MPKPLIPIGVKHPEIGRFLKTILRSGLLDKAQLREAVQSAPAHRQNDPKTLAEHLVRTGKLSRFQAHKLLHGAAGGLVLGPYQILAPIGKGGQSTVYLARDNRSQMLLALKVLPPKKAREKDRLLARFRREMEICQRVAHPHLAWTQEVGVCLGVYYIAMEFIPGKSLYRLVNEQGPLTVPHAARLFAEVASALDHAHGQGLIHRDLKPSNILVTPNDHAKVLDLGLALIQGEVATDREVVGGQGYVVGTMDYIAPEQTDDATKVDARSDIYGLGCTLYFALTGRPPFPGGDSRYKITRHRQEEPISVAQANPAVPPAFAIIVEKMMAKRPEQRFTSAARVREELLRWTSGAPQLPLDQAGDQGYQKAMADLQAEDIWGEAAADEFPGALPGISWPRRTRPSLMPVLQATRTSPPSREPGWWIPTFTVALWASLIVFLGLLGLIYLLSG